MRHAAPEPGKQNEERRRAAFRETRRHFQGAAPASAANRKSMQQACLDRLV